MLRTSTGFWVLCIPRRHEYDDDGLGKNVRRKFVLLF
jgi:hypothetical protein